MVEQPLLLARRKPRQERALKRYEKILDTTAELLDEVGFDDLTTILIAKRLNISVGSLYHYFPNKHAVLWALVSRWLEEVRQALDDMDLAVGAGISLEEFVDMSCDRMLVVYRRQSGILPLVQAIYAVPELRPLDLEHDHLVIDRMSKMFKLLAMAGGTTELERLARVCFLYTTAAADEEESGKLQGALNSQQTNDVEAAER